MQRVRRGKSATINPTVVFFDDVSDMAGQFGGRLSFTRVQQGQ